MTKNKTANNTLFLTVLLGMLAALAPLSTDMYLPALPVIQSELGISTSTVQMTLTMTMTGMAIGQLFAGPVSDRFGRKTPLIIGMVIFTLSTVGCVISDNIVLFLAFRFAQGLSGSFGIVVARAIARDIYSGVALTRFVSMLMMVNGLAPVLAPVAGGQILLFSRWQGIFIALALIGLILTVAPMRLKETLPAGRRMKNIFSGFKTFGVLVRDKYFLGHCLVQCTLFSAFFAYISGSPFLFQNIYHVSAQVYSLIFGGLGLCIAIAGAVPVRLAGKISDIKMMAWAACQAFVGSIAFMICVLLNLSIVCTLISLVIIVSTIPIYGATSFSLSMRNHRKEAGAASALFGFSSMFGSGFTAPLVGLGGSDTAVPMAVIILSGEFITLILFWKLIYSVHRHGYNVMTKNEYNLR